MRNWTESPAMRRKVTAVLEPLGFNVWARFRCLKVPSSLPMESNQESGALDRRVVSSRYALDFNSRVYRSISRMQCKSARECQNGGCLRSPASIRKMIATNSYRSCELRQKTEGMHVDAESKNELENLRKAIPLAEMTMNAAVWRGANDEESMASVMDAHDHLGQVWIMFSRGKDPTLSGRFRENAMREIKRRWPDTLSLPIMPTGAIPLRRDLIRTPNGYIVNPSEAYRYQLLTDGRPQ